MGDTKVTANTIKRNDGTHRETCNNVTLDTTELGLIPKIVLTSAVSDDGATILEMAAEIGNGAHTTYGCHTKDYNRYCGGHGITNIIKLPTALLNTGALWPTDDYHYDNLEKPACGSY